LAEEIPQAFLQNFSSHIQVIPAWETSLGIAWGDDLMWKAFILGSLACALYCVPAMATCSTYPNSLTNGTTADASQVMANFNCAALTSGATIGTVTITGTTTLPGTSTLTSSGNLGLGTLTPQNSIDSIGGIIGDAPPSNTVLTGYPDTTHGEFISYGDYWELRQDTSHNFKLDVYGSGTPFTAVTVEQSGLVGIDTTSPSYNLHVNGSVAGTSAYVNLSDARLKKNVVPIRDALSIIGQLQGVRFQWRSPEERTIGKNFNLPVRQPQVGFIAQNVKAVLPEAVSVAKDRDATMSVAESKVVPVLVEALKELKAANDNQAAEIHALQTHVSALDKKLETRTASR
jgi:hypothetical protein